MLLTSCVLILFLYVIAFFVIVVLSLSLSVAFLLCFHFILTLLVYHHLISFVGILRCYRTRFCDYTGISLKCHVNIFVFWIFLLIYVFVVVWM